MLKIQLLENESFIFKPPTAYLAAYQQPTGSRFGADALYNGENRKYGGMFTYFFKESKNNKNDSLTLKFFDNERQIRTLKKKVPDKTGFYRWYWKLDEKGVDLPSRSIKKTNSEPGGVKVKPGNYRVVLESKNSISETEITVKTDPRFNISSKTIEDRYNYSKQIEEFFKKSNEAVNQLKESKKILSIYKSRIEKNDNESDKILIKKISENITQIEEIISF